MITKLQITGKLHYHRKCDFQLSKRKLGYRILLPLTAPIQQCSPSQSQTVLAAPFSTKFDDAPTDVISLLLCDWLQHATTLYARNQKN